MAELFNLRSQKPCYNRKELAVIPRIDVHAHVRDMENMANYAYIRALGMFWKSWDMELVK
jgi:hypothetical protein